MYYRGGFLRIFILFIVFSSIIDIVLGLFGAFLPLVIIGAIGYFIYKMIKNNPVNKENKKEETKSFNTKDIENINEKLKKYFDTHDQLPIVDDLSFVVDKNFTNIEEMYVAYKQERVCKLSDFKEKNKDAYFEFLDMLLAFTNLKEENDDQFKEFKKQNKVLSKSEEYIELINSLNSEIPNEEITNSLKLTCEYLNHLDLIKNSKSDENKLKKLYDYYLPILIDILEKYKELQNNKLETEEFKKTETQLLKTLNLINSAMKNLVDILQEDDYMNINADIDTLQSLLKKDGYVDTMKVKDHD